MRKKDLEILKNLKKQEREKKLQEAAITQTEEAAKKAIPFDVWWIDFSKSRNLKPHIKDILKADFKARKLKDQESRETFDMAAAQFGYK